MVGHELEDDDVDLTSEQLDQALFPLTYPFSENELDFGIAAWQLWTSWQAMLSCRAWQACKFCFHMILQTIGWSIRFVRTWWEKKDSADRRICLHRSRFVARQFSSLTPDGADLYSPASTNVTTRLIPLAFLEMISKGRILCGIDCLRCISHSSTDLTHYSDFSRYAG